MHDIKPKMECNFQKLLFAFIEVHFESFKMPDCKSDAISAVSVLYPIPGYT